MPRFTAVIGQPPPFALSRSSFRFPALAALAGSSPLGGNRESAVACFVAARLGAALLPPYSLPQIALKQRSDQARAWIAALTLQTTARQSFIKVAEAAAGGDRQATATALESISEVVGPGLDEASRRELAGLARSLAA